MMTRVAITMLSLCLAACGSRTDADTGDESQPEVPAPVAGAPEPECVASNAGLRRCSGAVREICDGSGWRQLDVCGSEAACDPTHCGLVSCDPDEVGDMRCNGANRLRCAESLTWEIAERCGSAVLCDPEGCLHD